VLDVPIHEQIMLGRWHCGCSTQDVPYLDVEQIARMVIREYALPYRFREVTAARPGECTVGFSDAFSGATLRVNVWCDAKASPYAVRESLKRGLDITD
jgi:hypothetical protein